ncbi:MAG: nitrous oxide-stimulated promoter family protein [Campylobacterota bacterium]|nr:nitrous oxide-stimulated promoter family protein [Campylobacterota bacterium]
MSDEKFQNEIETLDKFITNYCTKNHNNQKDILIIKTYNNQKYKIKTKLCSDCESILRYSTQRLEECPHDIKPRCRKCPSPCYEKQQWKQLAKIMRYSGFQLALNKIKNLIN